jgi:hypothetical protein
MQNGIDISSQFITSTSNFISRQNKQKIITICLPFYTELINLLERDLWPLKHFDSEVTILNPKTILPHLMVWPNSVMQTGIDKSSKFITSTSNFI